MSSHGAMSIKEILEELPKLTPEERQYVREWLAAEDRERGRPRRPTRKSLARRARRARRRF